MNILQFGYETRFRETSRRRRRWMSRFWRPVSPIARLHFLVTLRRLKSLLPVQETGRILEAGAKHGHASFWLARFFAHHVVALDLDPTLVVENQRLVEKLDLKNLSFIQRDLAQSLNLPEPFDLVLCSHVLEHIEADVTALKHLFDVLVPGGYLMVLVPGGSDVVLYFTPEELKALGHVRAGYTLAELEQKVKQAGFHILSGEPIVGLWGAWANQLDYNLCQKSESLLANGVGWVLASLLTFLEYWFPIKPQWEVLLVAQRVS